ncbi:MAG: 1-acyl-sn-glycerol-3-phosphate acyltransferase [Desulfobulbaceae bacterium]|nr:MAG: 1-acyl-sn-glycerol-3-phosphate acyltransferase [Desulfobulbaceae bacterium]
MALFSYLRGFLAVVFAVLITPFSSLQALLYLLVLRTSEQTAQVAPRTWARLILAVSGVKVRVEGMEKLESGKSYIFAANHQSQFDIFCLQGSFEWDFRWLAKKELFRIPIFGPALRRSGNIPIDRSSGRKSMVSLNEAAQRIKGGCSVVIFPEGTRSVDGNLLDFKAGGMMIAIKAGVGVVPMAICGTRHILPKGKILPRAGEVVIRLGDPLDVSGYSLKEKQKLADDLRWQVAELLGQEGCPS